ncbi:MAG: hypothetical protein U1F68_08955 [Gammaproteobacteria bacterium]
MKWVADSEGVLSLSAVALTTVLQQAAGPRFVPALSAPGAGAEGGAAVEE